MTYLVPPGRWSIRAVNHQGDTLRRQKSFVPGRNDATCQTKRSFNQSSFHRCLEPHPRISIFHLIVFVYQWEEQRLDELCLFVCVCVFKTCCQMSSSAPLWNCITHSVNINWCHLVLDKQSYRGSCACDCLFERCWNNSALNERSSELHDHYSTVESELCDVQMFSPGIQKECVFVSFVAWCLCWRYQCVPIA